MFVQKPQIDLQVHSRFRGPITCLGSAGGSNLPIRDYDELCLGAIKLSRSRRSLENPLQSIRRRRRGQRAIIVDGPGMFGYLVEIHF